MIYLDASFLVSFLIEDGHSDVADLWWASRTREAILSAFAACEFSAVMSRGLRTGRFSDAQARAALDDLDSLRIECESFWPDAETFATAEALVRDFRLKLSAPDALHLASAAAAVASISTFDARLAEAARAIGVEAETLA